MTERLFLSSGLVNTAGLQQWKWGVFDMVRAKMLSAGHFSCGMSPRRGKLKNFPLEAVSREHLLETQQARKTLSKQ
jgi:hypothetical protein